MKRLGEIFLVFLKLGCTSFGGPVAHLGFFRQELVIRRRWISEQHYADVIALCQFLPGPASSQVGMTLGLFRGGWGGGLAAWLGFTAPSALIMIGCAFGLPYLRSDSETGLLIGLKVAAVAVVAHALWGMARRLCPDRPRQLLALGAAALLVLLPGSITQIAVILGSMGIGILFFRGSEPDSSAIEFPWVPERRTSVILLGCFFGFLLLLPVMARLTGSFWLEVGATFFRIGALVFGGGHVILPLMESEVVQTNWLDEETFLAGYGAAQALPGPLFTLSAFVGTAMEGTRTGSPSWMTGIWALFFIFLPSWFLVPGVLSFWNQLRTSASTRSALQGANAGVVGLLLAALYDPVWTGGITGAEGLALGLVAFAGLAVLKIPAWAVVLACGLLGKFFF